jgi:hypothetical protein
MIVNRFVEHYPAVFVVSKAILTTLTARELFKQKGGRDCECDVA